MPRMTSRDRGALYHKTNRLLPIKTTHKQATCYSFIRGRSPIVKALCRKGAGLARERLSCCIKEKRPLSKVVSCTAYQSRTDDLLRERQLSWTTRRMRRVVCGDFSLEIGCKSTTFFRHGKIYFLFFLVAIRKTLYHSNEKIKLFLSSTPIPSAKTHQNALFFTKIGTFLIEKYLVSDICIS